jgi:hypothetical protein
MAGGSFASDVQPFEFRVSNFETHGKGGNIVPKQPL